MHPTSDEGMTWHPPADPTGSLGWGQRLDHFLLPASFTRPSNGLRLQSIKNLRGVGSSDHNPLLLTLSDPGSECEAPQASVYRVDITDKDTAKTHSFKSIECPRVTIEIEGMQAQVFCDSGAPFSIYNPGPNSNKKQDHFVVNGIPTGSKKNCLFTGATGGQVTAEQNYLLKMRVANKDVTGAFVVLRKHEPNLPPFLLGMDILIGEFLGMAVLPAAPDRLDEVDVIFGLD
jgi:hypothetical protein